MLRSLLLFALLSAAAQATGETIVTLERDGAPVAIGEICRFPARDREDPFRRWLVSQTLTCTAAGTSLTLPPGLWNVFGKVEGKAVSNPQLIDGSKAPEKLTLALVPAATITPQLATGKTAVFYATRRGIALPFIPAMQRITVPAGDELWAIVMEKARPVGIVPIPALEPGTERVVDLQGSVGGPFVLSWLQVPEEDRAALMKAQGMSTPRVHLTTGGSARESEPLPPLAQLNGAFILVKGVTAGSADLDLAGRGWIASHNPVKIETQFVTVASRPLIARGAGSLFVSWDTLSDLEELNQTLASCSDDGDRPAFITISIAACRKAYGDEEEACRVLREEKFPVELKFGTFTVDELPPGSYRAELRYGKLPPIREGVELHVLQQQRVNIQAEYFAIYGGLTHGGEPVHNGATMKFPAGGVGFAERKTGEYHAILLERFGTDARIDVAGCLGNFRAFALTSRGCSPNARLDIDIPDNKLEINVIDTFTREPLEGATVKYSIMSLALPIHPVVSGELKTTREGLVMTSVPEREIRLSVSRSGYQKKEIRPFTMPQSDTKTVDVEMVPLRGSSGRIVSPRPFDKAWVYWFSVTGKETEHAELEADGSFIYAGEHGQDETMVVVSLSHPLWVTHAPTMQAHTPFTIRFPETPIHTFDITIPATDPNVLTYIGLAIGGLRVPLTALRVHQELRDLPYLVKGSGPQQIRDIAESGPIEVILGPRQEDVPVRMRFPDPLALPAFATNARKRLPQGAPSIVLQP